jgi:simple sugar transport system permease protein
MAVESKPTPPATPPAPEGPANGRAPGSVAKRVLMRALTLRESSIIVVTLLTFAYFAITTTNYLTYSNWKSLLPYFCFLAIMAAGQVFVMTLGEIDLSIGAMYLVTPIIFWKLNTAGIPLVLALVLSILIAMVFGAINGFFTAYVGMPSFVATLAMLFFLDGLALILSHSEQITTPGTAITHTTTFAKIFGAGTYAELIWAVAIVVILQAGSRSRAGGSTRWPRAATAWARPRPGSTRGW